MDSLYVLPSERHQDGIMNMADSLLDGLISARLSMLYIMSLALSQKKS